MTKKSNKIASSLKIPKTILIIVKFLSVISSKILIQFVAKLFTTPLKHRIPKRELEMDRKSKQILVLIPNLNKNVMVYFLGQSPKKILLVHGWSGRGTQLFKFADELIKLGYSTISFDAPAHGKSSGKSTLMPEFVESILELDRQFGPFEAAIGHSLGGMSLLNSAKKGLKIKRLAIIGSGDIVKDIMDDFIKKLGLHQKMSDLLCYYFEKKSNQTMDSFSAYKAAKKIDIPVLVIHDKNDDEVPVKCAIHIHKYLKNGKLMLTQNLGHRKILGNNEVIEKVIDFIQN
ncbi:alpha/beta hydrolase [Flavobacterium psychrotolerans]|uniref:Alpha/beta hydrolase n=1 Tax=Flavobacterium psychrotolerans TaxID=2169410 RepID=A0A2U1JHY1_9FLAO|nr:alpha/beta hydrolase [Flavobacterium psychrotolerans]PWA04741.1 alpha/beta hydrolase [Flavobacterium psychrotolerans]